MQDRLLTYGNNNYTYTLNGELASKTDATGIASYTYDALGNLTKVLLPDGRVLEYIVDGANRRIAKKVDGVITKGFLYEGSLRVAAELDATGNVVSRFVYATGVNVPEYMVRAGVTYRIITDHLGSVRMVVDVNTGAVAQELRYDEFGVVELDTNPGFTPFGFAGGLYDADTKLTRFGARDYDAETGRWTAKDPIGFNGGDTNLYGYVLGDPVNWVDARGLYLSPWHGLITFAAMSASGKDPFTAAWTAGTTMAADFTPGSQAPENAYKHGMTAPDQTVEQAKDKHEKYIKEQIDSGEAFGLGNALHAAEDQFSSAHGFQTWDPDNMSWKDEVKHFLQDASPVGVYDAFMVDLDVIKRYDNRKAGCP